MKILTVIAALLLATMVLIAAGQVVGSHAERIVDRAFHSQP